MKNFGCAQPYSAFYSYLFYYFLQIHDTSGAAEKKFSFFAIGVGEDVDMEALSRICTPNRPPKKLSGMKFSELFKWLSDSATSRSSSTIGDKVALPATTGWDED